MVRVGVRVKYVRGVVDVCDDDFRGEGRCSRFAGGRGQNATPAPDRCPITPTGAQTSWYVVM